MEQITILQEIQEIFLLNQFQLLDQDRKSISVISY